MKKSLPQILFAFIVITFQGANAQEWLIMHILETGGMDKKLPFFGNDLYDKVTSQRIKKDTAYFGLKGQIKSFTETNYYVQEGIMGGISQQTTLLFNKSGLLTLNLQGDTSKIGRSAVEHYYYDSDKHLTKIVRKKYDYNYISLNISEYNSLGYLTQETDSFGSRFSDKEVYHYKTIYTYFLFYTQVIVTHKAITKVFPDLEGGTFKFNFDKKGNYIRPSVICNYDSLNRNISYSIDYGCGSNSALCMNVSTKYDKNNNIVEQMVIDNTTRNSKWSFSSHFKAKYNEQNLIVEKTSLPVSMGILFPSDKDLTDESIVPFPYTYEYTFDKYGNWITMKGLWGLKLSSFTKREITYYQ